MATYGGETGSEERYISLLTDFGFKRIFGTKPNKDLLTSFLNTLFHGEQVVSDVTYLNSENIGDVFTERKAIFDVYCENEKGEKFIVEMQNAYQAYFKDRSIFYTTFPIREQAPKGDWDFNLKHVYTVALLNFDINDEAFKKESLHHEVKLLDTETKAVFYDKLTFIYIEIAKFNKSEEELVTMYDKWLYVLKNMPNLKNQPKVLQDRIFSKLFKEAEIARFTPKELKEYEDSMKAYRDIKNSINTAVKRGRDEGLAEGLEKGRAEGLEKGRTEGLEFAARNLLRMGMTPEQVSAATGIDVSKLKSLTSL